MGFWKWLLKKRKTADDFVSAETDLLQIEELEEVERSTKREIGRVYPKFEAPDHNGSFVIEYGPKYEPKPRHKVLMPNGIVFYSEWYTHPDLGPDGWMRQPPHFSIPKINKMIEKDERAREKNKEVPKVQ